MKTVLNQTTWQALLKQSQLFKQSSMMDLFSNDTERFANFSLEHDGILLDYSRQLLNHDSLKLLCKLAEECDLSNKIKKLFDGAPINRSENRAALHTAFRNQENQDPATRQLIESAQQKLFEFAKSIQSGDYKGTTGKPIQHIINIGIGGSYLGPLLTTEALKDFAQNKLKFHFISTVDEAPIDDLWDEIDPETSLFIVSSKSFSTIETLTNAQTLLSHMQVALGKDCAAQHFVAITAKPEKAAAFGIQAEHVFPIWDWVGGRYSIWSAIGLPLILMIGAEQFGDFLAGAKSMDDHFQTAPYEHNMPVLLALMSIWYRNFFETHNEAIIPYAYRLRSLVRYLQQAVMESNGKSVDQDGHPQELHTSPIIFGEEGCNGQHTYHQLLHQGDHLIPVDFILLGQTSKTRNQHQLVLLASALSQSQALLQGKSKEVARAALSGLDDAQANFIAAHQAIPGNRPSNFIYMDRMTPYHLGALLALYEHKIFTQSVIWNINPFDQWGVELGKQLLPGIMETLQTSERSDIGLVEWLKKRMTS